MYQTKNKNFRFIQIKVLLLFAIFISCKKTVVPNTPGSINGLTNVCPGETNIQYSINPVNGANYYLWTVPEGSEIISGQGTTSITINFGKKIGAICVRSNNDKEVSQKSCLDVKQGGISNRWCRALNFLGGNRQEGVAFSINNKGYFGTGTDVKKNDIKYNDFWEYDPIENTWSQKADFGGVARVNAVGFAINNKGYIGNGRGSITGLGYIADFWEYDPTSNTWTKKADYNIACTNCFAFTIGNKAYVGGGTYIDAAATSTKDFFEFDPLNGSLGTFTKKADLLIARSSSVGFSIANKGYFGLGSFQSIIDTKFMEYDPTDSTYGNDINGNPKGKWIYIVPFSGAPRNGAVAFNINNKGYICSGLNGTTFYSDMWEFDPLLSNPWILKTSFPGGKRTSAAGFVIGNNGYVGAGNDSTKSVNDFWIYAQ